MIPLRASHIVFYAAVVTVTVSLAVGIGFWFIRAQMLTGNDFLLDAESKEIVARVARLALPIDREKLEAALHEHTENDASLFYFQVHDRTGKVLYHSPNLDSVYLTDLTGGDHKRTVDLPPLGLLRIGEYYTSSLDVQIAMSLRNFQSINSSFLRVFLLGVPFIAVLSIGFGLAMRHATLKPVRSIQAAAQRISASNLGERIAVPTGSGEMAALARLLNEMIERLEKSFNHTKRFTADISHELMTPLSVIRLHSERLLNDPELPSNFHHSVEEQLQATIQLAEILERLLTLAKADSSALPLKLEKHSTVNFIEQFAEDAQLLAESRGLTVEIAKNDGGEAVFDYGCLRQTLFNLLSNALRFSPPSGTIKFFSTQRDEGWTVEVWDEGQGVPASRLDDIFERFVQITPRSEPGSGVGLGLAICRSLIELHHGRISAHNRTDRSGLAVVFSFPVK